MEGAPRSDSEVFTASSAKAGQTPIPDRPAGDTLPPDFPQFEILVNDNPSPGVLYISPFLRTTPRYSYLTIFDTDLNPVRYQRRTEANTDFKLHPNGRITFYDRTDLCFYAMDSSWTVTDTIRCGNGYPTDGHDIQYFPNGHILLMSYEDRIVDMSAIVPGGNPAAVVTGLVLEELDPAGAVVFEWRSWDHFAITDATHEDLTAARIDYVHANAFDIDTDGNILLSSRHLDEITKINRTTGAIMWRLGGRNNQFTFLNDSLRFSYQHDIRRLPNGNITLFDNGNYHVPPCSRAVEYHLDEPLMTAELVWEYRDTACISASATGNVQRLPNGNTLISWGTENLVTEVRPDGSKALEFRIPPAFATYRTFKFPLTSTSIASSPTVPLGPSLLPAYPNPFNNGAVISYVVRESGHVTIAVYNIVGRRVAVLLDGRVEAGEGSVQFRPNDLSSGIYLVRMEGGGGSAMQKVVFIK